MSLHLPNPIDIVRQEIRTTSNPPINIVSNFCIRHQNKFSQCHRILAWVKEAAIQVHQHSKVSTTQCSNSVRIHIAKKKKEKGIANHETG